MSKWSLSIIHELVTVTTNEPGKTLFSGLSPQNGLDSILANILLF